MSNYKEELSAPIWIYEYSVALKDQEIIEGTLLVQIKTSSTLWTKILLLLAPWQRKSENILNIFRKGL